MELHVESDKEGCVQNSSVVKQVKPHLRFKGKLLEHEIQQYQVGLSMYVQQYQESTN